MKIKDMLSENRPRERLFEKGASALSDAEVLALIIQKGFGQENAVDLSNRVLTTFSLEKLNELSLSDLQKLDGIGLAKATQIIACFELSRRVNAGRLVRLDFLVELVVSKENVMQI